MYNQSDPSTYNLKNISGQGLDRSVDGNAVTYTYHLREHRGLDDYSSSSSVVHSSSSCIGRNFFDGSVYEKGARVGTLGKPAVLFFGQVFALIAGSNCLHVVGEEDLEPSSSQFLHILDGLYNYYGPATNNLWAMDWSYDRLDNPSACVTTCRNASLMPFTFWQCANNTTISP
jgi:hypothetical protein